MMNRVGNQRVEGINMNAPVAAGELILRPPAESSSLALPGSGRGRPERCR